MTASAFFLSLLEKLVAHPENLQIQETQDDLGTLLTLTCHPEDMKIIIGRQGQTVQALRTILRMYGSKHSLRVNLKVIDTPKE
jgi:predicted RNA-binding protein YlqC (UPF0109 family)